MAPKKPEISRAPGLPKKSARLAPHNTSPSAAGPDAAEAAFVEGCCAELGPEMTLARAKGELQESLLRSLQEMHYQGLRLGYIKAQLPHGAFGQYVLHEFSCTLRYAQLCLFVTRRLRQSGLQDAQTFLRLTAGSSRKKMLAILKLSDEELQQAERSGELLGFSFEAIRERMSYRQLEEALRTATRDRDRARRQRDESESRKADLQDQVDQLTRRPKPGAEVRPLTRLEREFGKTVTQLARLLDAVVDAPEAELVRDGQAYLTRLNQEMRLLSDKLLPFDPEAGRLGTRPCRPPRST